MIEDTIKIIQLIEHLHLDFKPDFIEEKELMRFFNISFDNGVSHHFLTSIIEFLYAFNYMELITIYEQYNNRELQYIIAFKRITNLMFLYDVDYVVFKTLKPYPFMGSSYDIDLLILTISNSELKKILNNLKHENYDLNSLGNNHVSLHDMIYDINIDLYITPSYADMIYLDKAKLSIPNKIEVCGVYLNALSIEEELLIMMLDSVYSDRRYQLKEYYNILLILYKMNQQQKHAFKELVHKNNMQFATNLVLHITQHLYYNAHKKTSRDINEITTKINPLYSPILTFELKRLMAIGTPMRYHIITFIISHMIKHGPFDAFLELITWGFIRAFYYELKIRIKRNI